MFTRLIHDAAARFNLGSDAVAVVVRGVLAIMTDESAGGLDGFVDRLRRARLGTAVDSWISDGANRPLTDAQIRSALGEETIGELADSAVLARGAATAVLAYLVPRLIDRISRDGRLPTTTEFRSMISGPLRRRPRPVGVGASDIRGLGRRRAPRRRRGLAGLAWLAVPALALAAWLYLRPGEGHVDPILAVNNAGAEVTYTGQVRDEAARATIIEALNATFGEDRVSGNVSVDAEVREADWIQRVDAVVSALNTPGAELTLSGDSARVGGWLTEAERSSLTEKVRDALGGAIAVTESGDRAAASVRFANALALRALARLDTTDVRAEDVVNAMNLSVIDFEAGSAELPDESAEFIRSAAAAIQRAPRGTRILVAAHTDAAHTDAAGAGARAEGGAAAERDARTDGGADTGRTPGAADTSGAVRDAVANLALSRERARAVADALVEAGVNPAALQAEGYGDTRPIASNDTPQGRFRNRRIEYAVVGTPEPE